MDNCVEIAFSIFFSFLQSFCKFINAPPCAGESVWPLWLLWIMRLSHLLQDNKDIPNHLPLAVDPGSGPCVKQLGLRNNQRPQVTVKAKLIAPQSQKTDLICCQFLKNYKLRLRQKFA